MTRTIIGGTVAALLSLAPSLTAAEPQSFATPGEAVASVISALEARDRDGLIAVFGAENEDVILSGDPQRDVDDWSAFFAAYKAMNRVAVEGATARLFIGPDQWPMPIPLVQGGDGRWQWDAATGREELLDERIGRNELDVIELMRGYVRVQARFRQTDHDGDGVMEFAASILSDAGTRDGLYWPSAEGVPESPLGDFVARASAIGYSIDGQDQAPDPYLGYYYKLLTRQGAGAPGGAMDYMVNGNMLAGHALIAFPADHGASGIMSFLVGENGVVYEKDLGDATIDAATAIDTYDPGDGWAKVEAE